MRLVSIREINQDKFFDLIAYFINEISGFSLFYRMIMEAELLKVNRFEKFSPCFIREELRYSDKEHNAGRRRQDHIQLLKNPGSIL